MGGFESLRRRKEFEFWSKWHILGHWGEMGVSG
jgi:hypothetical protein